MKVSLDDPSQSAFVRDWLSEYLKTCPADSLGAEAIDLVIEMLAANAERTEASWQHR